MPERLEFLYIIARGYNVQLCGFLKTVGKCLLKHIDTRKEG